MINGTIHNEAISRYSLNSFFDRLFNNQLEIPSFLYYVVGMFFLLIVSLTYWKDQRIGLSLFVLIVAIMTGFVAVAEIY